MKYLRKAKAWAQATQTHSPLDLNLSLSLFVIGHHSFVARQQTASISPSRLGPSNRHKQLLPLVAGQLSPLTLRKAVDRDVHDPRSM